MLDEYSWQAIREAFRGLMLGGLIVCATNAAVAAAWDLSHVFMRIVSAATGTVVFFPFGWLGFAPVGGGSLNAWGAIFAFHVTAVIMFYCAILAILKIDRRHLRLWQIQGAPDSSEDETRD